MSHPSDSRRGKPPRRQAEWIRGTPAATRLARCESLTQALSPVLLDRLRHHRDDVLATLRQPINPYRRPAHQGGAPQAVLDSLADAWDREPEDAEEQSAIWEEQTGRSVFGGPAAPMLDPQQGQALGSLREDAPESVAQATLEDELSQK